MLFTLLGVAGLNINDKILYPAYSTIGSAKTLRSPPTVQFSRYRVLSSELNVAHNYLKFIALIIKQGASLSSATQHARSLLNFP